MKYVDPDGRECWEPEITSLGKVSYVAEKGDTKESFSRQYNVSQAAADKIFNSAGITNVSEGTRVSGGIITQSVTNKTDRAYDDVLKLDWRNSSDAQKAYQAMFAILCGNIRGAEYTDMNAYFSNLPPETGADANLTVKNATIPLPDGKRMRVKLFDTSFSKRCSSVIPQPIDKINVQDMDFFYRQTFVQKARAKYGIQRILVSFSSEFYNSYSSAYY